MHTRCLMTLVSQYVQNELMATVVLSNIRRIIGSLAFAIQAESCHILVNEFGSITNLASCVFTSLTFFCIGERSHVHAYLGDESENECERFFQRITGFYSFRPIPYFINSPASLHRSNAQRTCLNQKTGVGMRDHQG